MGSKVKFYVNQESKYFEGIQIVNHAVGQESPDGDGNDGHRVCALLSGYMGLLEIAAEREAVRFVLRSVNPTNDILPPSSAEPPSRSLLWTGSMFLSKMCMCVFHSMQLIQLEYPTHLSIQTEELVQEHTGQTAVL